MHHRLAEGDEGARRDPRPVPPRDRHRADGPRRPRPRAAETIKGHVQSQFDGVSMRGSFDDAKSPSDRKTQFYSMLGSRSIWHEGWKAVTTHPTIAGWGHFNEDEWELYHTDVDRSELHNLAAEQPDKVRELVNIWFSEAGYNIAFPLDDRSAVEIMIDAATAADGAARPIRLLPRRRRGPRVAGGQYPRPLVRDRGAGRHPGARARRASCSPSVRGSAATPSTSRTTGCTTSTASSAASSRRSIGSEDIPTGDEPDPVRLVREGRAGTRPRHRDPDPVSRQEEGRRRTDQDPARRLRDRRVVPDVGRDPGEADHRGLPRRRRPTRSPAARSTGSRSMSAASRTSTSSARRP